MIRTREWQLPAGLVSTLKEEEGFRQYPYQDADGQSLGYGTHLPITEEEAEILLRHRIGLMANELCNAHPVIDTVPIAVRTALLLMAYQMGVPRLGKFKKMWTAIEAHQWETAKAEALDSAWAKQTPARAKRVASMLATHGGFV